LLPSTGLRTKQESLTFGNAMEPAILDAGGRDYPGRFRMLGSAAVYVATVVDPDHGDFALGLVDAVQHSVGPSARREHSLELSAQLMSDAVRVLQQRAGDQIDDGVRNGLGKLFGERSCRWSSDD
jgi:hypothetical protein